MQYALVDNKRSKALNGVRGICECCKSDVIAKCGNIKLHHWAHQSTKECDRWWEPETTWHREWKNLFPESFREVMFIDKLTGEPHRADIHTDKGITVEFQHSHIEPQEQSSREAFYKDIVWVINGARLKRDFPRFVKEIKKAEHISKGIFKLDYPEECFSQAWVKRPVPVIFDFSGTLSAETLSEQKPLYCLLPDRLGRYAIVAIISRDDFVEAINQGHWFTWVTNLAKNIQQVNQELLIQQQRQNQMPPNVFGRQFPRQRRRRF